MYDVWAAKHEAEKDRLGREFVDMLCIVETAKFVKMPEDLIGFFLFLDDVHVFNKINEWKRCSKLLGIKWLGTNRVWDEIDITYDELEKEMKKYFI